MHSYIRGTRPSEKSNIAEDENPVTKKEHDKERKIVYSTAFDSSPEMMGAALLVPPEIVFTA
jgi:hypothetical protein